MPTWLFGAAGVSRLKNQYGVEWNPESFGNTPDSMASIWDDRYKALFQQYVQRVFDNFGNNFYAVYLSIGQYGEVSYPIHGADSAHPDWQEDFYGHTNCYWAYDSHAQQNCPVEVRGWKPGDVPAGQKLFAGSGWRTAGLKILRSRARPPITRFWARSPIGRVRRTA